MEDGIDVVGLTSLLFSFRAFCIVTFKDTPLNVIQLNWHLIYNSKGLDNNERSFVWN